MHSITWNGVNSATLGVRIERSPRIIRPRRKVDVYSVPGRNGDIVLAQDAWNNYSQPYEIFFGTGAGLSAETAADAVSQWLNSAKGYAQLEDTYEPDIVREAYYVEEQSIENAITEYGRETIRFVCKPQRYLKTGLNTVTISSSGSTIQNPTGFISRPLIRINGSGACTLTVVGFDNPTYTVSISSINQYINLDCEEQNAYKTAGTNLNNTVTITAGIDFPRLAPGENKFTWTGNITSLVVTPRWFRI